MDPDNGGFEIEESEPVSTSAIVNVSTKILVSKGDDNEWLPIDNIIRLGKPALIFAH